MPIAVKCANCSASFRVPDQHAGKRGKCPKCQGVLEIPRLAAEQPAPAAAPAAAAAKPAAAKASAPSRAEPTAPAAAAAPAASAAPAVPGAARSGPAAARPASQQPAAAAMPSDAHTRGQQILAGFQGPIEPVQVPVTYHLGAALVAATMVLLPLVYVALVVLFAYLIYLHAIYDVKIFEVVRGGRAMILAVALYVGPIVAGAIAVLFMIKPLFARPARIERYRSLTPQGEPLLFAFVERICTAVGAPQPRRIDVDCQVNASASFRRGWLSMLSGGDLVLTIGLPLVSGLNLREFAGVLAHEFGHFSQGTGMRLTYVIRSISMWFTRVVYERDEWDERLAQWARQLDVRIGIGLHLARLAVWLTRKILWVLMMIGHVVSTFMLRQMEFDADRYEARLAGSDTFESTSRKLVLLTVATQGAFADLDMFYQDGRLGDDLPKLILANVGQIPREVRQKILKETDEASTGLLDTHPANKDRIASARQESAAGIFRLDWPASTLLTAFEPLCKNVTWDYYRGIFGPDFKATAMHPVDDLIARQGQQIEASKALGRYFQGSFHTLRAFALPDSAMEPPVAAKENVRLVKAARQKMLELKPAYDAAYKLFDEADDRLVEAGQASALLGAGLRIKPAEFGLAAATRDAAAASRSAALERQQGISGQLAQFEMAAIRRMAAALQLLHVGQVAGKVEGGVDCRKEVGRIMAAMRLVQRRFAALLMLRTEQATLGVLLANLEGNTENQGLIEAIREQMGRVVGHIRSVYQELADEQYPFDHARGEITIADFALDRLPPPDELGPIFEGAGEILQKVPMLYARCVGRLAHLAEQVETALGLPQLPEPPEEEPAQPAGG